MHELIGNKQTAINLEPSNLKIFWQFKIDFYFIKILPKYTQDVTDYIVLQCTTAGSKKNGKEFFSYKNQNFKIHITVITSLLILKYST